MTSSTLTDEDVAFLASLEAQLFAEVAESRAHPRWEIKLDFSAVPARTSPKQCAENPGRTLDVSLGGLRGNMSRPLSIGDHYRVRLFTTADDPIEITARCLRCAFIDEKRFEVVLRFTATLDQADFPMLDC